MTELPNPKTEAPHTTRNDSATKPTKPKRKSDVHPDPRILTGFASATVGVALVTRDSYLKGITIGLVSSATCTGFY